jgi:hypothetical protein
MTDQRNHSKSNFREALRVNQIRAFQAAAALRRISAYPFIPFCAGFAGALFGKLFPQPFVLLSQGFDLISAAWFAIDLWQWNIGPFCNLCCKLGAAFYGPF